jgi:serine/threonine protein kinase
LRSEVEKLLESDDDYLIERSIQESCEQPQLLTAGQTFSHYEIIRQLGSGGMGEVYLAMDLKLDRKVAVKILNDTFGKHEGNLQRFLQEAKAASSLNHPNVLIIHEVGENAEGHFIVSEFIDGKTLRQASRGPRSWPYSSRH